MQIGTSRIGELIKPKRVKKAAKGNAASVIYSQRVEKKAYELFEKRGCRNGNDWQDWFDAEKLVEDEMIAER